MRQITLCGDDYRIGLAYGKCFREYLQEKAFVFAQALTKGDTLEKVEALMGRMQAECPQTLDEVKGRADGAEISLNVMLLMLFPEVFKSTDGCTTIIVKNEEGDIFFSHNEDEQLSEFHADNTVFLTYQYDDHTETGYNVIEHLPGSCFGYNSYGLVFSSNFIAGNETDLSCISRYVLQREVLRSASVEEAIACIQRLQPASAFNMNIFDVNRKIAVNVEKDTDKTFVTEINGKFAHSNHFLNYAEPIASENSLFRKAKADELLASVETKDITLPMIREFLSYQTEDLNRSIHFENQEGKGNKTVANFACDSREKTIRLTDFFTNEEYTIKLN